MAGYVEIIIGAVGEVGAVVELSKQSRVTTLITEVTAHKGFHLLFPFAVLQDQW